MEKVHAIVANNPVLELNFCKIEVRHTFGKKKSFLLIFSF